ncbi:MAG TPA: LapA family protein [Burkholderiales bacterium]
MRLLTWAIRVAVFLLLIAFAAKNVEPVPLRFFFNLEVQSPLVLALLGAFALGALFGVLALVGTVVRLRREISRLKRPVEEPSAAAFPPPPPI